MFITSFKLVVMRNRERYYRLIFEDITMFLKNNTEFNAFVKEAHALLKNDPDYVVPSSWNKFAAKLAVAIGKSNPDFKDNDEFNINTLKNLYKTHNETEIQRVIEEYHLFFIKSTLSKFSIYFSKFVRQGYEYDYETFFDFFDNFKKERNHVFEKTYHSIFVYVSKDIDSRFNPIKNKNIKILDDFEFLYSTISKEDLQTYQVIANKEGLGKNREYIGFLHLCVQVDKILKNFFIEFYNFLQVEKNKKQFRNTFPYRQASDFLMRFVDEHKDKLLNNI